MYYQNQRYQEQVAGYKKMIDDKEVIIMKLNDDERQRSDIFRPVGKFMVLFSNNLEF
jgi:hypothetical protein